MFEKNTIKKLHENELEAFEIFRTNKYVTKTGFVEYSGLHNRTAERMLKKFVDLKLIRLEGVGRSTKYIIN